MSKKGEERLRRKNEKALRNDNSNVRLAQSIIISDSPIRSTIKPEITNEPRAGVDKSAYQNYAFCWDLTHADRTGSWSWGEERQWSDEEYKGIIDPHFNSLENNSWREVENLSYNGKDGYRKLSNKYQSINTLEEEAQNRWEEHETMSQFEWLFRLRLGSKRRAWGVRVKHYFFMVWYERNHMIYRVDKD